jgi:uncharacterized protein
MIFGLTDEQFTVILQEADQYEKLTRLVIFGPRATGDYEPRSEVDLAVWGLDAREVLELQVWLNEYSKLPCKFEVVRFESLNDPELKKHIIESGKTIYSAL